MRRQPAKHPAKLLQKLGVHDGPVMIAVTVIAVFQYIFLLKLWEGYLLKWSDVAVHSNVVTAGIAITLLGVLLIPLTSFHRWRTATAATRQLERPARDQTFNQIRHTLHEQVNRSSLAATPDLWYTPKNINALEVRHDRPAHHGAVVVGVGQRKRQNDDPEVFAAELGHEISHLELGQTSSEVLIRRLVGLHFRVIGWLVLVFIAALGFIDTLGIPQQMPFGGFLPIFDLNIYVRLTAHFAVLALSSFIIFLYSYYFVVRREHLHDLRGSQLVGSNVLADRVFEPIANSAASWRAIRDFFELHPSPARRAHVVRSREFILLSPVLFPLVLVSSLPIMILLATGWENYFGIARHWWNLGVTVGAGLLLYMILSADLARLGIAVVVYRGRWVTVLTYSACAGVATQLSRIVIGGIYGWRDGVPVNELLVKIGSGIVLGGGRYALMIVAVLLGLAWLSGVRVAAQGEGGTLTGLAIDRMACAIIVIGAFSILSLQSLQYMIDVTVVIGVVVVFYVSWFVATNRCTMCGRWPWETLGLGTKCKCGHERLRELRRFVEL